MTSDGESESEWAFSSTFVENSERLVHVVEAAVALIFIVLFTAGVVDLGLGVAEAIRTGTITDAIVVSQIVETGLLLLIVIEVYQTIVAYIQERKPRRIVRLVVFTGVIAMVRKVIVFRTGEYETTTAALFAAAAYAILILGLASLLVAEHTLPDDDDDQS